LKHVSLKQAKGFPHIPGEKTKMNSVQWGRNVSDIRPIWNAC